MTPFEPYAGEPIARSHAGGTPAGRIGAWRGLRLGWRDFCLLAGALGLMWGLVGASAGMIAGYSPDRIVHLDIGLGHLPGYAGRTMLRMWIAYACSLLFAIPIGFLAAHCTRIRGLVLATIDVLQSIPVLGFLSITAAWFIALSGRSILGVECAAIFAIFTAQVWNLVFSVFHSVARIPTELKEAAASCRLSTWQRITNLDLPASIHSLLWNSLMSFGSGWFFVCQSEAISTRLGEYMLPGLGSYLVAATDQGNASAAIWCLFTMGLMIVLSDQLVWRPLLVWAERFKIEQSGGPVMGSSWFYQILSTSAVLAFLRERILARVGEGLRTIRPWIPITSAAGRLQTPRLRSILRTVRDALLWGVFGWLAFFAIRGGVNSLVLIHERISLADLGSIVGMGLLTLSRVLAATAAASIIWIPLGIWIGQRPKLSALIQPVAQLAASFPVNMTFPFIVGFFVAHRIPINWGSILLIGLGTQWYVLFNVVGAVSSIPADLLDASRAFGVKGRALWRILFLPAIFPSWVTGACTAAGGAWNASVVGEIASWGSVTLKADGLGALVSDASRLGDNPLMLCSIAVMSALVLMMNRLVWRPLFGIAERKFRFD